MLVSVIFVIRYHVNARVISNTVICVTVCLVPCKRDLSLSFEGNLVAVAGSCGGLMVKHPWPLLEMSLLDFRELR